MITALEQTVISTLVPQTCGECGIVFGLERTYRERLVSEHGDFYCPNGHGRRFTGETEADRLKRQLQQTQRCLDFARGDVAVYKGRVKTAERQIAARKGIITRMKRRLVAGRCVCCLKQFKDLETHMANRHPKFNPEKAAEALTEKASA